MRKFLSFFCLLCVLSLSVSAQFYNSVGGSGVDIEGSGVDIEGSGGEGSAVGETTTPYGYGGYWNRTTMETTTQQPTGAQCGFNATLTEKWMNFTTPGFPEAYPNDASCTWQFKISEPATVQVQVYPGATESCCDYIELMNHSGDRSDMYTLGKKGGTISYDENFTFAQVSGYLMVNFYSDSSVSDVGYSASIKIIKDNYENEEGSGGVGYQTDYSSTSTPTGYYGNTTEAVRSPFTCMVGLSLHSDLFTENELSEAECDENAACMRATLTGSISEQIAGFNILTELSSEYGMCIASIDDCGYYNCSMINDPFSSAFESVNFEMTECTVECCDASGECVRNVQSLNESSLATSAPEIRYSTYEPSPSPTPTVSSAFIYSTESSSSGAVSPGSDDVAVSCNVGFKMTGSFEMSDQETVLCRSPNGNPACVQMSLDTHAVGMTMNVNYGMCVPNADVCAFYQCDQMMKGMSLGMSFLEDFNMATGNCSVSCCRNGSCQENESILPATQEPVDHLPGIGGVAATGMDRLFVAKEEFQLFPACTLEEYIGELMLCETLLTSGYPYNTEYRCKLDVQLFIKCYEQKTSRCLLGPETRPNLWKFIESEFIGSEFYESSDLDATQSIIRDATMFLGSLEMICTNHGKAAIIGQLRSMELSRMLRDQIPYFSGELQVITDSLQAAELYLADVVEARTSQEFCRNVKQFILSVDSAYSLASRYAGDIIGLVLPDSYKDTLVKLIRKTDNTDYMPPKCVAFEAIRGSMDNCAKKKMDLMFVVQGSGFDSDADYAETMNFIKNTTAYLDESDLRFGLIMYSSFDSKKSLRQQIKTSIPFQNFNSHENFSSALDAVKRHEGVPITQAYAGRALRRATQVNFKFNTELGAECTKKVLVLLTRTRSSDIGVFRSAMIGLERQDVVLFIVGTKDSDEKELKAALVRNNMSNQLMMVPDKDLPTPETAMKAAHTLTAILDGEY